MHGTFQRFEGLLRQLGTAALRLSDSTIAVIKQFYAGEAARRALQPGMQWQLVSAWPDEQGSIGHAGVSADRRMRRYDDDSHSMPHVT